MNPVLRDVLLQTAVWFLLAGSIAGIALGIGLLVRASATLAFVARMNRWVSTDRALQLLDAPRRGGPVSPREGRWIGALILLLGGYCLLVLVAKVDTARFAAAFGLAHSRLAYVVLETLHWLLALGCAGAVIAGALLAFFPRGWAAVEARANRQYWTGQLAGTGDRMHLALDETVARSPRLCGALLIVLSLVSSVVCAWIVLRR
jgi:hypothetical protein